LVDVSQKCKVANNILLEQNVLDNTTLSFDDNKVLKKCQLDILISVQVCRNIDKNLSVFKLSIGYGRTNESNEIYKKEACVARNHMKKRASEDAVSS